jgi:hypothetical protein
MSESTRHALPFLSAGQAQKEVTHNEALMVVDRLLHPLVLSRNLSTPPSAPASGDSYIPGGTASGAWAGQAGKLATYDGFGWVFTNPVRGCLAWIADEGGFSVYDSGWSNGGWPAAGLRISGRQVLGAAPTSVSAPAGGALIDLECRAAVGALISTLRAQGIVL